MKKYIEQKELLEILPILTSKVWQLTHRKIFWWK